jgi:peptide/nickel transport system ATP-binding protein/oligopeptide transport system ATP-binding protein
MAGRWPVSILCDGKIMEKLLSVENISKQYNIDRKRKFYAVSNVSFHIGRGETLGLVGESGCGKTTIGKLILKLISPTDGEIRYSGENIIGMSDGEFIKLREKIQMIFQDPYSSLNPRMKTGKLLRRVLMNFGKRNGIEERIDDVLTQVGMSGSDREKFPHQFSGGQRQRIAIARALIANPEFVVLDEPTSSLDVSVQAKIMNLLSDLKEKMKITYLFISHDLSIIRMISDRIIVMYAGKILERASSEDLFNSYLHPYTEKLLNSIPEADPAKNFKFRIEMSDYGMPSSSGCPYYDRCDYRMDVCKTKFPEEKEQGKNHFVRCYKYL